MLRRSAGCCPSPVYCIRLPRCSTGVIYPIIKMLLRALSAAAVTAMCLGTTAFRLIPTTAPIPTPSAAQLAYQGSINALIHFGMATYVCVDILARPASSSSFPPSAHSHDPWRTAWSGTAEYSRAHRAVHKIRLPRRPIPGSSTMAIPGATPAIGTAATRTAVAIRATQPALRRHS